MKKFRDAESYTPLQMEAALCAWEWMCEHRDHEKIARFYDGLGTFGMRMVSIQAGDIARQVHSHMEQRGYEFTDAYDWEFVPGVLLRLDWDKLIEDNQYSGEPYTPDIHAIFCSMVSADMAANTDPILRSFQKTISDKGSLEPASDQEAA